MTSTHGWTEANQKEIQLNVVETNSDKQYKWFKCWLPWVWYVFVFELLVYRCKCVVGVERDDKHEIAIFAITCHAYHTSTTGIELHMLSRLIWHFNFHLCIHMLHVVFHFFVLHMSHTSKIFLPNIYKNKLTKTRAESYTVCKIFNIHRCQIRYKLRQVYVNICIYVCWCGVWPYPSVLFKTY